MSDESLKVPQTSTVQEPATATSGAPAASNVVAAAPASGGERLDGIEEIDFLLEEIEGKIAPLALA